MAGDEEAAGWGGFDPELASEELLALRKRLGTPAGSALIGATLGWMARELEREPDQLTPHWLERVPLWQLALLRQGCGAHPDGSEPLLAELLLLAAGLAGHAELLPGAPRESLVEDLSELIDLLPRSWGELCARAIPAAEEGGAGAPGSAFKVDGFEVYEPIGHGGMGQIRRGRCLATGQAVAIKFLASSFQSEDTLLRFEREGRLLASLEHPGIARFLGSGTLMSMGARVPYLVMELIEGEHLTTYVQEHALDEEARIRLFIKVCEAIEYAHSKGVIHRDLHPRNLLVAADGQPKVLDFGIARAVNEGEEAQAVTRAGQVFGVAAYISPEQAAGTSAGVDVRMDVYALGAILFELLSGETPHDLGGLSLQGAWRRVSNTAARRLRLVLPRADRRLEGILAQALASESGERYATVHALGGDLFAYLEHGELRAPELSVGFLARLLYRRHRTKVWLSVGALCLLLSTAGWAPWSRQVAVRAGRSEAQARSGLEQLTRLSVDALIESWEHEGPHPYVRAALRTMRAQVDAMQASGGAEFLDISADLAKLEGEWAYAAKDFKRALEYFHDAEARLAKQTGVEPNFFENAARRSILLVRIGDTAKVEGDLPTALAFYDQALALDRSLAESSGEPRSKGLQDNLCWSLIRRAEIQLEAEDFVAAMGMLEEAELEVERLLALDPERAHSQHALGRMLERRVRARQGLGEGHTPELAALAERAVASSRRATQLDPGRADFEYGLRGALRTLAELVKDSDPGRARDVLIEESYLRAIRANIAQDGASSADLRPWGK